MDFSTSHRTIASVISSTAPDGWKKSWIEAAVTEDTASTRYWYETADGKRGQNDPSARQDVDVAKALIFLRNVMRQDGKQPWSRAVFTLTPDGKFNLEVAYDD